MIRYCPSCWSQNTYEAKTCMSCGASLDEKGKAFADRLIEVIGHPEPTRTAIADRSRRFSATAALTAPCDSNSPGGYRK
jgi:uncharacterized membrane protein YvbJ